MYSISDPRYVYRPWPEERRKAMSEAARRRSGAPPGHRMLYGVVVEDWLYDHIAPLIRRARANGHPLSAIRYAIKMLINLLSVKT